MGPNGLPARHDRPARKHTRALVATCGRSRRATAARWAVSGAHRSTVRASSPAGRRGPRASRRPGETRSGRRPPAAPWRRALMGGASRPSRFGRLPRGLPRARCLLSGSPAGGPVALDGAAARRVLQRLPAIAVAAAGVLLAPARVFRSLPLAVVADAAFWAGARRPRRTTSGRVSREARTWCSRSTDSRATAFRGRNGSTSIRRCSGDSSAGCAGSASGHCPVTNSRSSTQIH